jgi:uncharacterized protein YlbG (UPF0298 family)
VWIIRLSLKWLSLFAAYLRSVQFLLRLQKFGYLEFFAVPSLYKLHKYNYLFISEASIKNYKHSTTHVHYVETSGFLSTPSATQINGSHWDLNLDWECAVLKNFDWFWLYVDVYCLAKNVTFLWTNPCTLFCNRVE